MAEKANNPCGLKGFAFLEFSAPNEETLHKQFQDMGFMLASRHTTLNISQYQQGNIQFIVNAENNCQAADHARVHGAGACAMGFRVEDADAAFQYAISHGAEAFNDKRTVDYQLPAIKAIGGSVIYFVDDRRTAFEAQWEPEGTGDFTGKGLVEIDHLTHNVYRGNMDKWADFYERIFNFFEIRFFNIKGQVTGLVSRALSSPCGKIKIPLNESKDEQSQIEEFLHEYNGEGIQHIALSCSNIYSTISALNETGVHFLDVPDTYYEMIDTRVPWHQESIEALKQRKILIDGEKDPASGLLLQIFTENIFGPVFFEIIQRKGNEGFGEGNFQALFEAIERDQMKRGTLVVSAEGEQ